MISADERADLIHILKMKHFALATEDASQLLFTRSAEAEENIRFSITINSRDDLPVMEIQRTGNVIFLESFKSVDDLKIFLEDKDSQQYFS